MPLQRAQDGKVPTSPEVHVSSAARDIPKLTGINITDTFCPCVRTNTPGSFPNSADRLRRKQPTRRAQPNERY